MDWNLALSLISIISFAIAIHTSLLIGLSLVEVNLSSIGRNTIFLSLMFGLLYYLAQLITDSNLLLIALYAALIPIIIIVFKVPFTQTILAILLALIYDLAIIKLFAHNLFDIALLSSDVESDPVIQVALTLFVMMSNIFISLVVYRQSPVLFPKRWLFPLKEGAQSNLYKFHLVFIILILLSVNIFLYYTYTQLLFFTINYRVFVMFWTILTCFLLLFFSRNIVVHNIERIQFTLDKEYQKDLLSFYTIIRSQRHDFNIHLNAIYGLINNDKYEESRNYIEDVVEEARQINDLLPLHHPAIGAMLSTLNIIAMQKGITLNFHLQDDLKDMPCTIYEVNKILGNLINNAMEEIEKNVTEKTEIDIEISREHDYLLFAITNETTLTEQQLQHMFDLGFSTKLSHEGIGLPTIADMIARYGGVLFPVLSEGTITMNVRIPITQK